MMGFIYKITNKVNGKVYIGQTIQPIKGRWYRHCCNYGSKNELNMHIKRAILKYGKENFEIEVLEECAVEELNTKEKHYINLYGSYKEGYNSTKGGQGGAKPTKATKEMEERIVFLYGKGTSLRRIGKEYKLDKATVKRVLERHNVALRETKTYKWCSENRQQIVNEISKEATRKEIMEKYGISKSYLSQLLSGSRRI